MKKLLCFLILLWLGRPQFSCAQGESTQEDSLKIEVTRLSINSNRGDFGPFLLDKKLYFSSGRVHRYGLVYTNEDTTKELDDIFYAAEMDSLHFKKVHYFSEKVNTKFNDGPLCFNRAGDVLYITGNDEKRMTQHKEPLDIFTAKKVNGHWEHPVSLPFCTGTASYCHPALLRDEKTLIFSSDMPGGMGGMDLYMTKFENGKWSTPQNLGSPINSKDNEIFPFISANGTLYFASSRKGGPGGLDLYQYDLNDPFGSDLYLLPAPLNSDKDDFGIWADSTGDFGYISSNRGPVGDDDIYLFKNKYPAFQNCGTYKKPGYCYTFYEESTLEAKDTLGMTYEWDLGDGTKKRGLRVRHCFPGTGNYTIQLNIIDKASGALFYNQVSYDFTVEDPKQLFIDCPDTIAVNVPTIINCQRTVIEGHTIKDIFWYFGDGKFSLHPTAKHTYRKEGNYIVKLGVIAKNDSTGKESRFCTQKNILVRDSAWIRQKASSVTKTTWPPAKKGKTNYQAKGDSMNYRVHLGDSKEDIPTNDKIFDGLKDVKKQKREDTYTYTSGNVKKLSDAVPYYLKAKERGFKNAAVIGYYGDSLIIHQEKSMIGRITREGGILTTEGAPQTFKTTTIWFDFDRSSFSDEYKAPLDSICDLMKKNKKLGLIILSISDSVGTTAYNFQLSKKRADNVKNYILQKGIKPERLDIIPLGEKVPEKYRRGKNVVISNRRVELLLVKKVK
jgi:outer membrane protein OmpA-like peptidoglycan-associated protein